MMVEVFQPECMKNFKISIRVVMTSVFHAGEEFDKNTYKVSGGLQWCRGLVNALSNMYA